MQQKDLKACYTLQSYLLLVDVIDEYLHLVLIFVSVLFSYLLAIAQAIVLGNLSSIYKVVSDKLVFGAIASTKAILRVHRTVFWLSCC